MTAADVLPGRDAKACWVCERRLAAYEQNIAARTKQVHGCPECHKERVRAAAAVQGGNLARGRKHRTLGKLAADPASPPPGENF